MRQVFYSIAIFAIGVSCFPDSSTAAVITWGAVQATTTSAADDIVDGGEVILAINGQSQLNSSSRRPGSVVLDGITFQSLDYDQFLGASAIDDQRSLSLPEGRTTGDADYDVFLNHVAFVNTSNATNTANTGLSGTNTNAVYPIQGLTAGQNYLIQLWYTDERTWLDPRTAIFGDNESTESVVTLPGRGANGFGNFVIGNFTADATTQDLRIAIDAAQRSHLTGLMVRAIPEPSAASLLGFTSLLLVARRRKR
ncbi:PEP-CTERM sorting domain-containing protein [Stieleria sp. JC731]|uniref:PEP-CTERM sorting domain-containing protein n=1 Tax=Pirellulaceae TaxID=2691357 RepID=UPI001E4DF971|nr:PEP-CTERM sorting domain-containing protein [Stieleria sp. JC731]MCC9602601.1 PEP-CTERM sorting domain-containing protein [Stieleria sp. JC731]